MINNTMDEDKLQDDLYTEWCQCGELFRKCSEKFNDFLEVDNCEFIKSSQIEAGKLFLKTGKRIEYPFALPSDYLTAPETSPDSDNNMTYYAEYWLCALNLFIQNCHEFLEYQFLPQYELPYSKSNEVDWGLLFNDTKLLSQFYLEPPITDWIIKASIRACDLIAELRSQQTFRIQKSKQILSYRGHTFHCGRVMAWDFVLTLFEHKNTPVSYNDLCNKLWPADPYQTEQQRAELKVRLHKTVNDICDYLTKNHLTLIAKAIKNYRKEGYMLDCSQL